MNLVETLHLSKAFTQGEVLRNINLEVEEGEILTIVGPNGSGKTTLLRLIDLLEAPTSGKIYLEGVDTTTCTRDERLRLRRRMAMVFQRSTVFNTSVYENVAYGLRIRGEDRRSIEGKVEEVLELLELSEIKHRKAVTLSGGEAQRVALARAIVLKPRLLLLDEPTSDLDPRSVVLIEDVMRQINREQMTTVVMATQNMFQAKRLAHRVAFLLEGSLIEVGGGQEIFENPRDGRTAAFIKGEMVY
ncbi:MAG: phosphate ABC transporter ATP-binding protein [Candidatus Geothermarchaeales archaeon]